MEAKININDIKKKTVLKYTIKTTGMIQHRIRMKLGIMILKFGAYVIGTNSLVEVSVHEKEKN